MVEERGMGCAVVDRAVAPNGTVVIDRVDADGVHGRLTVPALSSIAMAGLEGEFLAPPCEAPAQESPLACDSP